MSNTSRFKVISRKTVSISHRQQNITSVGDIERKGQVVRVQMSGSFPNGLTVQFMTGQTTADVANVIYNSIRIIAAASDIAVAPVIAYSSRMRFVG